MYIMYIYMYIYIYNVNLDSLHARLNSHYNTTMHGVKITKMKRSKACRKEILQMKGVY